MVLRSALVAALAALVGLFAVQTSRAAVPVDVAWALEGGWLVSVGTGERDRVLQLSGVKLHGRQVQVAKALYGYIDGKSKPVEGWQAEVIEDAIRVRFITSAESEVEVEIRPQEAAALGQMKTAKGKIYPVRLTHLTASELADMRETRRGVEIMKGMRFTRDTRIELLYVGARDCPSCAGYEVEYFGRKNLMAERLPEFPQITYTRTYLGSFRTTGIDYALPAHLAPLARKGFNGEAPALRYRGTPFFVLLIDGRIVTQVHGLSSFDAIVIPQARQAVAARLAAN
jgi:hypothetical protein